MDSDNTSRKTETVAPLDPSTATDIHDGLRP